MDQGSVRSGEDGPDEHLTARDLLRRRDFAIYWWSQVVSGPGTWLHNVTASVLMLQLTGSPFMVGLVNFAIFMPTLLFSLPAGSLGDRIDKRRLVATALLCGAAVGAGLTVLSGTGRLTPVLLLLACFLIGTATAFAKPSLSAMIPLLVPRPAVARATAVNVMQFQFAQIVGPALAAVILVRATPTWGFGINAVSFLGPVVAMWFIRLRARSESAGPHGATRHSGTVREGLRFVRHNATMPGILVTVVLSNAAVEALRTLAPTLADDFGRPAAAGVLIMGYSVGAFAGLLSFGLIQRVVADAWVLAAAFMLEVVGVVGVALAPTLPWAVLAAAPIGIGFSLSIPLLSASVQNLSPDAFQSRVMSVFSMAHLGARPFFALLAGGLATLFGAPAALAVFSVLAALAVVYVRRRRIAQP